MKKTWTNETAKQWISKVNSGREKYGLTFCSACDFLKMSTASQRTNK